MTMSYIEQNWIWLVIVFFAIVGAISLVKTILKWVIILVILIGALVYGLNYAPTPIKELGQQVIDSSKSEALATFMSNTSGAVYSQTGNKYIITIKGTTLSGTIGQNTAKLKVLGKEFDIEVNSIVNDFIKRVKDQTEKQK
jgi:hypothetical protein